MNLCIELAKKSFPKALPNPLVGCVIVYQDKIIGQGYHQNYGQAHAEVNAISSVNDLSLLKESTLYVSLEPCSHFGKTPPCADLIIAHKIPRVVIGSLDTFSEVNGQGIQRLKSAGIHVKTSVLEDECRAINRRFFTFHEKHRPYIILKWAQSADGFMAPSHQDKPFWLTGKDAKQLVHQWRTEESAILVGKNTVIKDNPRLTAREVEGNNPIRLIIDKSLSLASEFAVFNSDAKTYIINEKMDGEQYLKVDFSNFMDSLLQILYQKGIQSLVVEGGATTLNTFIQENKWDEARIFTSKKYLCEGLISPVIKKDIHNTKTLTNDSLTYYFNT